MCLEPVVRLSSCSLYLHAMASISEAIHHPGILLLCAGVILPEVTVEYDNINVEADALVGSASIPSLSNVALGIIKVSSCSLLTPA